MRILVLSLNAWNLSNSTGNTISNLFRGLEDTDEVANIYCRNEAINNTICKKYFRVTEGDIIRCLLTLKSCGTVISYENAGKDKEIHSQGGTNYEKKFTILKKSSTGASLGDSFLEKQKNEEISERFFPRDNIYAWSL